MGLLQNQNIGVLDWRFVVLLAKCWHVIVLIFYLVCERLLSLGRYTMKIEYEWQDVLSMRCQKWYKDLEELCVGSDVGVKKKLTWLWTKIAENTENTAERLKRCRWWRESPAISSAQTLTIVRKKCWHVRDWLHYFRLKICDKMPPELRDNFTIVGSYSKAFLCPKLGIKVALYLHFCVFFIELKYKLEKLK